MCDVVAFGYRVFGSALSNHEKRNENRRSDQETQKHLHGISLPDGFRDAFRIRISLLHVVENRADDSSDDSTLHSFAAAFLWQIFFERVSESGDRKRLQPDSSRSGQLRQKDSVAAENHIFNAGNSRDLE